jgi:hypothetical protein
MEDDVIIRSRHAAPELPLAGPNSEVARSDAEGRRKSIWRRGIRGLRTGEQTGEMDLAESALPRQGEGDFVCVTRWSPPDNSGKRRRHVRF